MKHIPKIKLYGTSDCHKTNYYRLLLNGTRLPYKFLDVDFSEENAQELRGLYENRKLNFPTVTIGKKKLRNPHKKELEKWLGKLIPSVVSSLLCRLSHHYFLSGQGKKLLHSRSYGIIF